MQCDLECMIAYAKDRVIDDLTELLDHLLHYPYKDEVLKSKLLRLTRLLSMPDNEPETLAALSISYWNGNKDTIWENCQKPEKGFVGFHLEDGQAREL